MLEVSLKVANVVNIVTDEPFVYHPKGSCFKSLEHTQPRILSSVVVDLIN